MTRLERESRPTANRAASKSLAGDYSDSTPNPTRSSVPRGYIHGIDGKRYPRPLGVQERLGLIAVVHVMHHEYRLSIRQIIGALETQHGIRRSLGTVSAYLSDFLCADCSGGQVEPPEQLAAARRRREAALRSTPLADGRRDPHFGFPRDGGAA